MLLEADQRHCLEEVIVIAAALEGQDVRQRPAGKQAQADEAHLQFLDPHSDFLSYIRLWDFYHKLRDDLGRARLQRALNQNFLSLQGFREWSDIVRQLKEILAGAGIRTGQRRLQLAEVDPAVFERRSPKTDRASPGKASPPEKKLRRPQHYAEIHQSLLAGLLSGIAARSERHEYQAARGLKIFLWPGSGLFKRQPNWIISAEIVETTRRFGRTNAEVDVAWIEQAGAKLLKHSYHDPHWSSKSGSAMVYQRSTLYGLPIVAGRRVPLAPLDPAAARALMIEHGLVAGEWKCQEKFYVHNQELLADLHEVVQRTRSRDFILDRFHPGPLPFNGFL
jgi:ATP-dependent helicase HrpA